MLIDGVRLTNRQYEILQLLQQGLSNQQIASKLFIACDTVKAHMQDLKQKTGKNRIQLAVWMATAKV